MRVGRRFSQAISEGDGISLLAVVDDPSAVRAGLELVVAVSDEDELRLALDRLDPEILLLSARETREDEALEHVLGLLPDVPAGKLAIAELAVRTREEILELERAGVDAVVVRAEAVARLVGDLQPQP